MDYRLPGLDGVQATAAVLAASPGVAVVALTASANEREVQALLAAGATACLTKDRELDEIVEAILAGGGAVRLDAENTAIVLDSTADFPDAADHFPNWRVVPLYVLFGDESYRDGVDLTAAEFYERLRDARGAADDVPADARRLPRLLPRSSPPTSGSSRSTSPPSSPARTRARRPRPRELGDGRVRTIDSETASASITMLALAIQRRLERGTSDEEVDGLVDRYRRERGSALHRRHARVPRPRRPDRPRPRLRRDADERQADPLDRRRRGGAREARARQPQGVPGVRRRARDGDRATSPACGSGSRTPPRRSGRRRSRSSSATGGRRRRSSRSPSSAPSSARTQARGRSASSGSRTIPEGAHQ